MSAPTPGPWRVVRERIPDTAMHQTYIYAGQGQAIVFVAGGHEVEPADARLIASAPDLLAALKAAADQVLAHHGSVTTGDVEPEWAETFHAMRAAIAAAEGREVSP